MGGPWKDRTFDAGAWRAPAARESAAGSGATERSRKRELAFVLAYVASVPTAVGILVLLLQSGW
jgi:hypothetical protein